MKYKKIISAISALFLVLTMNISAFAQNPQNNNVNLFDEGEEILEKISYDEYIAKLAKSKNITKLEAINYDNQNTEEYVNNRPIYSFRSIYPNKTRSSSIDYYEARKTFTYSKNSDYKAQIEATMKIGGAGSMWEILDVISINTKGKAGANDWEWIEKSAEYDIISANKVNLLGRGYFRVEIGNDVGGSVDIPGFSVGKSTSWSTFYDSETMNMVYRFGLN